MNAPPALLSSPQVLLVVALDLGETFHESDLLLAAWKIDPQRFGLRRYESQWPDVNRCRAALCHRWGPHKNGYFERVDELTYKLTPAGRIEAEAVRAGQRCNKNCKRVQPPPDIEEELGRMTGSRAWRLFLSGQPVSFADALQFWGSRRDENPAHVAAALDLSQQCLADAGDYLTGEGLVMTGGRVIPAKELDRLRACDASLREAFAKDLERRGM